MGKRPTRRKLNKLASQLLDEMDDAGREDDQACGKSFRQGEGEGQAQSADPIEDPSAPSKISDFRARVLASFGVNIGANAHTVLSYNPRIVQAGANFLVVMMALPRVNTKSLYGQWIVLVALAEFYAHFLSDHGGSLDLSFSENEERWRGLTRFVLGLFVSLLLAKTYYNNRGCFGTVFGCTMGLAQMTTAWVRAPLGCQRPDLAEQSAREARQQLVCWGNAAFRLMVLECRPLSPEQIGEIMIGRKLLTAAEWAHIADLKSRATHIYQWMNNALNDLLKARYIHGEGMLVKMHTHIDDMRGANVWGLPSLPIMYTLLVTCMVKFYLFQITMTVGAYASAAIPISKQPQTHVTVVFFLFFVNYLFQGLLDLHGILYSPNQGIEVSHLPADNFLNFVETVTTDLVNDNEDLPYEVSIHREYKNIGGPRQSGPRQSGPAHDRGGHYSLIEKKTVDDGKVPFDACTPFFSM